MDTLASLAMQHGETPDGAPAPQPATAQGSNSEMHGYQGSGHHRQLDQSAGVSQGFADSSQLGQQQQWQHAHTHSQANFTSQGQQDPADVLLSSLIDVSKIRYVQNQTTAVLHADEYANR